LSFVLASQYDLLHADASFIHQACAIADWALLEREMFLWPQNVSLEETVGAVIYAHFAIILWCFSMTLIKTSVVLTLLRLPLKRTWKIMLYIILVVQLSFGFSNTVYNLFKCQPYHAAWDMTVYPRQCVSEHVDVFVSHIGSSMNILTDLLLSIAPMLILWNLRRPLRERILICSLTGIGLFATFASIMKVVVITQWTEANDPWATAVSIATWTIAEQFVSILAACSPSLKKPIEGLLNKLGFPLVESDQFISFVHMPPGMRAGEARAQEREWEGSEDMHANDVVLGSMDGRDGNKDIELLGNKSPFTSASGSTSTVYGPR
jgi:hypothetical protein